MAEPFAPSLLDHEPERTRFLHDVLAGLRRRPRMLPCKYFYDERGSHLFEAICQLPEYYPTRTELSIMEAHASSMAELLASDCLVVEYGSGSGAKTRLLLDQITRPAAYVPVDISREHLLATATSLNQEYPELEVLPVCADFTRPFPLPSPLRRPRRTAVYFPGSTIGNFTSEAATALLREARSRIGADGVLLIGVDLVKEPAVLERAYDDRAGVTAAFNLNLLRRMNRELGADFDLSRFSHRARWCSESSRIEMHLVSDQPQTVHLGEETLRFTAGETICTEYSHKYTLDSFASLAEAVGLRVEKVWTDPERLFSVQALRAP